MNKRLKAKISLILCILMVMSLPGISDILPECLGGAILTHAYEGSESSGSGSSGSSGSSSSSIGLYPGETSYDYETGKVGNLTYYLVDGVLALYGNGEIPDRAFYGRNDIVTVKFTNSNITTIGESAFANCSKLENIYDAAMVTTVKNYAFANCEKLSFVYLEKTVESIGDYAFSNCKALRSFYGKKTITIGEGAFSGCASLGKAEFNKVKVIKDYAFANCDSITIIDLRSADELAGNAFDGCANLEGIIYYCDSTFDWTNSGLNESVLLKYHNPACVTGENNSTHYCSNCDIEDQHTWTEDGCSECLLIATGQVESADGEPGNKDIKWSIYRNYGSKYLTLKLSGTGRIKDYEYYSIPWISTGEGADPELLDMVGLQVEYSSLSYYNTSIYNNIKNVIVEDGITGLGKNSLYNISCVPVFPNTLKYIGITNLRDDTYYRDLIIPASVEEIGESAFFYGLFNSITFEEGSKLNKIGSRGLNSCAYKTIFTSEMPPKIDQDAIGGTGKIIQCPDNSAWREFAKKYSDKEIIWIFGENPESQELSANENGYHWEQAELDSVYLKLDVVSDGLYLFDATSSNGLYNIRIYNEQLTKNLENMTTSNARRNVLLEKGTYYIRIYKNSTVGDVSLDIYNNIPDHEHSLIGYSNNNVFHYKNCVCGMSYDLEAHNIVDGTCVECGICPSDIIGGSDYVAWDFGSSTMHRVFCKYCKEYKWVDDHDYKLSGCDLECIDCGYVREGEGTHQYINGKCKNCGITEGFNINGHYLVYDKNLEVYVCNEDDCEFSIAPGYYDEELKPLDEDNYTAATYVLLANLCYEYDTVFDFDDFQNVKILDLSNLITCDMIVFREYNFSQFIKVDLSSLRSTTNGGDFYLQDYRLTIHDGNPAQLNYYNEVKFAPHKWLCNSKGHHACYVCGSLHEADMVNGKCTICGLTDISFAKIEFIDAVDGNKVPYPYGKELEVKVMIDNVELVENTDYLIVSGGYSYEIEDNTLEIIGINEYFGTLTADWKQIKGTCPENIISSLETRFEFGCTESIEEIYYYLQNYFCCNIEKGNELTLGENHILVNYNLEPGYYEDVELDVLVVIDHNWLGYENCNHYCCYCQSIEEHNYVDGICEKCGLEDISYGIEVTLLDAIDGNKYICNPNEEIVVENIVVKHNGIELGEDDYVIEGYYYGYYPGKYELEILGIGEYAGWFKYEWEIIKCDVTDYDGMTDFTLNCNVNVASWLFNEGYSIEDSAELKIGKNVVNITYNPDVEIYNDYVFEGSITIEHDWDDGFCRLCGIENRNGLIYDTENGEWLYYVEGMVDYDYCGLVMYNNILWFVNAGRLDKEYKGIVALDNELLFVENGKVSNRSGVFNDNGVYYWITAGHVDTTVNGLKYANNEWIYFADGVIDSSKTGLVYANNNWWYVRNGKLDKNYDSLVWYGNNWWYVHDGSIDKNYSGVVEYNNTKWFVRFGVLDKATSGLVYFNDNWWFVGEGKVNTTYDSLYWHYDRWYYIHNGSIDKAYVGLVNYNNKLWYVKDGQLDKSFAGTCTYKGETYNVANGVGTK